jgi:phosphonate transport system substrate-binding protein
VLFVPSVNVETLIQADEQMEQDLHQLTGLFFEVSVPTTYTTTIELMCASPSDTIGFIPAVGYVLANSLCGVEPGLASVRHGWPWFWTQYLVARDSEFQTLKDLEGASWVYANVMSTSSYLYPMALLDDFSITISETIEAGGHPETVRAVYNGEVDFGTTFFSPPIPPVGSWSMGMDPDIPDHLVDQCAVNREGNLMCGGWRVLDARQTIKEEAPDVVQKVRILDISPEFPNDTMSFSPEFPDYLRQVIMVAFFEYIGSVPCLETLCFEPDNHYHWTGASPISDANFDGVRQVVEFHNLTLDDLENWDW